MNGTIRIHTNELKRTKQINHDGSMSELQLAQKNKVFNDLRYERRVVERRKS